MYLTELYWLTFWATPYISDENNKKHLDVFKWMNVLVQFIVQTMQLIHNVTCINQSPRKSIYAVQFNKRVYADLCFK